MPSQPVDRFNSLTHHHADFDLSALAGFKRASNTTISVVIPALNEEATVGTVVATLVKALVDDVGLIDEILVVDADSTDRTAELADAAGAQVMRQSDVLPGSGTRPGKGEALWKGLAASSGDIIVFIDADIVDMDERFVIGLVGPLLTDETIAFTKATYDRPFRLGDTVAPSGGGRVTELLARPLIAAFWPELSWLAQPLSGEYAGRRELLEELPFVCGYGVELAMLVDIAERRGPDSIVQVDLGSRTHIHQPLEALGRMSAEILAVAVGRLERQGRLVLSEAMATALMQPVRAADGTLALNHHQVTIAERPPLASWRARR